MDPTRASKDHPARPRPRCAWLVVVLAACSRRSDPSHAVAGGAAAPSAAGTATAIVRATDASAAQPTVEVQPDANAPSHDVVYPLPAPPPGADPTEVAIAASVCAAAYLPGQKGAMPTIGCRSHPPFTNPDQRPDGKLPLFADDDVLKFCAIDMIRRGSFLSAGAKQAVVSFSQCKDNDPNATWDSAFPGSALLVEQAGDRWKTVAFEDAVNTRDCLQARRADGRDVLLCQSNLWAGPAGHKEYFFSLDFGSTSQPTVMLAQIFGDNLTCYALEPAFNLPDGFVAFEITKTALEDVDKNGALDLVVDVSRARAAPSAALDAKVRALCKTNAQADGKTLLPPPKTTRLVFLAQRDGSFSPTPTTRKALDAWEAEAPARFNGLK